MHRTNETAVAALVYDHRRRNTMSDTTTNFQPGTNAYAGARLDARNAALASVSDRLGRGRGESTALVNLAKAASKAIGFYVLHPKEAQCEAAEQIELVFGTLIARLNEIAHDGDLPT